MRLGPEAIQSVIYYSACKFGFEGGLGTGPKSTVVAIAKGDLVPVKNVTTIYEPNQPGSTSRIPIGDTGYAVQGLEHDKSVTLVFFEKGKSEPYSRSNLHQGGSIAVKLGYERVIFWHESKPDF